MATATFRFHGELNDFLPPGRRIQDFSVSCARDATVKHQIEALGVPHTEVETLLVNDASVGFDYRLRDGDRVAVYPRFVSPDRAPLARMREWPSREARFVADAHLGGLARLLRLAGFDTRYDNHIRDEEVERLAVEEGRIVLSRDIELLKRRAVTHGCYVHAMKPWIQLREVVERLNLAPLARPFALCLVCNASLRAVAKADILERLPPGVRAGQERFKACPVCGRVYWEGSHWRHMASRLQEVLGRA